MKRHCQQDSYWKLYMITFFQVDHVLLIFASVQIFCKDQQINKLIVLYDLDYQFLIADHSLLSGLIFTSTHSLLLLAARAPAPSIKTYRIFAERYQPSYSSRSAPSYPQSTL